MSDVHPARKAMIARILGEAGQASQDQRRAAFDHAGLAEPGRALIDKVVDQAHAVTDDDIAAARASGLTEDQIFEMVVCASVGEATRQYDAALAALDAATKKD